MVLQRLKKVGKSVSKKEESDAKKQREAASADSSSGGGGQATKSSKSDKQELKELKGDELMNAILTKLLMVSDKVEEALALLTAVAHG